MKKILFLSLMVLVAAACQKEPYQDADNEYLVYTAPAKNIDFTDFSEAIPAFLAIIAMPFTYSISEGIALGVISYVLIHLTSGNYRFKNIGGIIYILAVLFVLKYIFV